MGVLVSLIVACDLVVGGVGWVCLASVIGVSFGIVGWVGGRGGLDRLVGEWVTRRSRCTCCCSNLFGWVLAFDCGLTGVMMGFAILCWGLVGSGGWLVSIVSVGWCGCGG